MSGVALEAVCTAIQEYFSYVWLLSGEVISPEKSPIRNIGWDARVLCEWGEESEMPRISMLCVVSCRLGEDVESCYFPHTE